jgi:hypothetical protein
VTKNPGLAFVSATTISGMWSLLTFCDGDVLGIALIRSEEAYDLFVRGKLDRAVSTPTVTLAQKTHQVGLFLSATGRFLVCKNCHLSFEFPSGANFEITSRQFDSCPCTRTDVLEGENPQ